MRFAKISADLLNDYEAQRLPASQFRQEFIAAVRGEPSRLAEFIKPTNGRLTGDAWAEVRSIVFARDNYTCQYCGAFGCRLECDHVIPISKGGSNDPGNLLAACLKCNRAKSSKTLMEWLR